MPRPTKWIRPLKDNPTGKVVADDEGNRWQWESDDATAPLLKKLHNEELAIEKSDVRPVQKPTGEKRRTNAAAHELIGRPLKTGVRDEGGGFNPYDSGGKPRRR